MVGDAVDSLSQRRLDMSKKHVVLEKRLKIDEFVDDPNLVFIRSTEIESTPSDIFHYLERVDKLGICSIRMREDGSTVQIGDEQGIFTVVAIEPGVELVSTFGMAILDGWVSYYIEPIDDTHTRLYTITKLKYKNWFAQVYMFCIRAGDWILQKWSLRKMRKAIEKGQ